LFNRAVEAAARTDILDLLVAMVIAKHREVLSEELIALAIGRVRGVKSRLTGALMFRDIVGAQLFSHVGDRDGAVAVLGGLSAHTGLMLIYADVVVGWSHPVSVDRAAGLAAEACGQVDEAVRRFEIAIEFCERAGYSPELAWSLLDYGHLLSRVGDAASVRKAVRHAEHGRVIADEVGVATLSRKLVELSSDLASQMGSASDPNALSSRESQVLELIAAGRTNQEIADELVVSVNTVYRHVTNVYRKLGVSNRSEATAYAIRSGEK
jgi:DNA-binding CsgD family transcriptional regulator